MVATEMNVSKVAVLVYQGKATQTFFPETGAPCLQSNSNQHHTPIKRLQPASH